MKIKRFNKFVKENLDLDNLEFDDEESNPDEFTYSERPGPGPGLMDLEGSYRIGIFDDDDLAEIDDTLQSFIDSGRVYLEGNVVWIDEYDYEVVNYFDSVWGWKIEQDYDDDEDERIYPEIPFGETCPECGSVDGIVSGDEYDCETCGARFNRDIKNKIKK